MGIPYMTEKPVHVTLPHSKPTKEDLQDSDNSQSEEEHEMSHHDLMLPMDDYCPSETSTDSLEYRSTDGEDSEAPIADDYVNLTHEDSSLPCTMVSGTNTEVVPESSV